MRTGPYAAFGLTLLIAFSMVLLPPHIRPAAYNQVPPALQQLVRDRQELEDKSRMLQADLLGDEGDAAHVHVDSSSLMIFVVFHKELHDDLYKDLTVPDALEDVTKSSGENATTLLLNRGVTFVAANAAVPKRVSDLSLYRHRVVNEWETLGYDRCLGDAFHEFGAMNSIFCSGWTFARGCEHERAFATVADEVLETSFVGILQYDFRIDTKTMELVRKRIQMYRAKRASAPHEFVALRPRPVNGSNITPGGGLLVVSDGSSQLNAPPNDAALRLSPMHKALAKQHAIQQRAARRRCCVFYAVSHPLKYLLAGDVGRRVLSLYNTFYGVERHVSDARSSGVLDGFVLPYADYNAMMLFVRYAMFSMVVRTAGERSCTIAPLHGGTAKPLDVMESAVALWLALLQDIDFVAMPIKHEKVRQQ